MTWEEAGGPEHPKASHKWLWMRVIGGSAEQLGGDASFEWQPSGLRCFLVIPLGANTKSLHKSSQEDPHRPGNEVNFADNRRQQNLSCSCTSLRLP